MATPAPPLIRLETQTDIQWFTPEGLLVHVVQKHPPRQRRTYRLVRRPSRTP